MRGGKQIPTLHFRAFDVDDPFDWPFNYADPDLDGVTATIPSAAAAAVEADVTLVDDDTPAGWPDDNRGTVQGYRAGFLYWYEPPANPGPGTLHPQNPDGILDVPFQGSQAVVIWHEIPDYPGDSVRIAGSTDRVFLSQLANDDTRGDGVRITDINDPAQERHEIPYSSAVTTPVLTVWRTLHVELDGMRPPTLDEAAALHVRAIGTVRPGYTVVGGEVTYKVWIDPVNPQDDDLLFDPFGQFDPTILTGGRLVRLTAAGDVFDMAPIVRMEERDTGDPFRTVKVTIPEAYLFLPGDALNPTRVELWDDDDYLRTWAQWDQRQRPGDPILSRLWDLRPFWDLPDVATLPGRVPAWSYPGPQGSIGMLNRPSLFPLAYISVHIHTEAALAQTDVAPFEVGTADNPLGDGAQLHMTDLDLHNAVLLGTLRWNTRALLREPSYWVSHVVLGFEGPYLADFDGEADFGLAGDPIGVTHAGFGTSLVLAEATREFVLDLATPDLPPAVAPGSTGHQQFEECRTVAHELCHTLDPLAIFASRQNPFLRVVPTSDPMLPAPISSRILGGTMEGVAGIMAGKAAPLVGSFLEPGFVARLRSFRPEMRDTP